MFDFCVLAISMLWSLWILEDGSEKDHIIVATFVDIFISVKRAGVPENRREGKW